MVFRSLDVTISISQNTSSNNDTKQTKKDKCATLMMSYIHLMKRIPDVAYTTYTVSQKSEPPKHFATATANLHQFKWNFTHTRRHLFLSSTSNFIRISYPIYEMFNSFKLLSQISVTNTTYFLLTSSVVTGVTSVRVDKQTTCYQRGSSFNKNAESWKRIRC